MNRFSESVNNAAVKGSRQISSLGPTAFGQMAGATGVEPYPFVR
jgi:hypothetical protein